MNRLRARIFWQLTVRVCAICCALGAGAADGVKPVSFVRDVAPIFVKQCQGCHGAEKAKGKYRLDSFERLMKAGDAPGCRRQAGGERDLSAVTAKDDDRMRKADPLPAAQVAAGAAVDRGGAKFDGPDTAAPRWRRW
jgi:hypothetical protein